MHYSAFGVRDELACLTPATFEGPNGDQVCLASKVSIYFFIGGVGVRDGGYVLRTMGGTGYYKLDAQELENLQAQHLVPTPLPPYRIHPAKYVLGYSLWIAILVALIGVVLKRIFGRLDPFLNSLVAPTTGPPVVRTEDDRWLAAELGKHLAPDERLQHQALVTNAEPGAAVKGRAWYYMGLTDRRLLFLEAKIGFLGLSREITEVITRERCEITKLGYERLALAVAYADEDEFYFWVLASQRRFTNQWLFARDVPKLLASELGARASAA
jgi:hypothetical protein